MGNISKITTFVQAAFHFERGEIVSSPLTNKLGAHIKKVDDDTYEVVLVPHVGRSHVYTGNAEATKDLIEDTEYDWYVVKGAELEVNENPDLRNRMVAFFENLVSSIFRRGD